MATITVGSGYIKSYPGILKIVECVTDLIGLIIVVASGTTDRGKAFLAAAIGGLIASTFFLIIYLSGLVKNVATSLVKAELFFAIIWAVFYAIVSSLIIATLWSNYVAAGVFGLIATIAYFADALHKYSL